MSRAGLSELSAFVAIARHDRHPVRPRHALCRGRIAGLSVAPRAADLAQHRCIRFRFESGMLYRCDLEHRGKTASIDVDGPMTLGNITLMVEAALAGIGIAWVPLNLQAP
jgi:DNA-binding transcriptional LysR family regulator